jgi:hypothetical protein
MKSTFYEHQQYAQGFGLPAQFGRLSADDRLNCRLNEFRRMRVVAPKSERQTATLDQK